MKKYPAPRNAYVTVGRVSGEVRFLASIGVPEREIRKAWSRNYQRMKKREKMKTRNMQVVHVTQIRQTGN